MAMQAPKALAYRGSHGATAQISGWAEGQGTVLATSGTSARATLPLSSVGGQPYAAYWLTALAEDCYVKAGDETVTAAKTSTNFDMVLIAGQSFPWHNVGERTHLAGIATTTGSLVITPIV